jgi:hypothetical protein
MRLILESHSRVFCYDELKGYQRLKDENYADVPPQKTLVGFKIPRYTEQLRFPRVTDYGLGIEMDQFYKCEPLIFMLRDVRDTVASMIALKEGEGPWLRTWGIPIIQWKIKEFPEFRERFANEIAQIHALGDDYVSYGALYWKFKTLAYFDYLQIHLPVIPVRYEKLTLCSEDVLRQVIQFLALDWEDNLLKHHLQEHGELFIDGSTLGRTNPKRSIDATSVDQWKNTFTDKQIENILTIAGQTNEAIQTL